MTQIKNGVWPGTGFEWQMVSTFSVRILRLGILDYLSRRSVYFGKFPFGQTKTVLPFTSQPKFPEFFGKWQTTTNTLSRRFQIYPLWRAFSKSSVFGHRKRRFRVGGRPIRKKKFSNLSGLAVDGAKHKPRATMRLGRQMSSRHFAKYNFNSTR